MPGIASSNTSSRTSTSSSTSEAIPPGRLDGVSRSRRTGPLPLLRLVHPFPSVLDGVATAAIAALAGAGPVPATRLGMAMTLLQFGIGATNDVVDAPLETARADKPVAAGAISRRAATIVAASCVGAGIALAVPSGPAVVGLAALGVGVGLAYDLRLKRTPWAWLPFAIGIPLLVVFAWYGGTGGLRPELLVLLPTGALAGGSLALGNALVDPGRDRAAGLHTPAVALGPRRGWLLAVVLHAATLVVAVVSLGAFGAAPAAIVSALGGGGLAAIGLLVADDPRPSRRERGWELQAVGVAVLGAAWVAGVAQR